MDKKVNVTKETNQYYGKSFEACVAAEVNKTDYTMYYHESYKIPEKELELQKRGAKKIAEYLNSNGVEYVGNHTMTETGDLIDSATGEHIELKCVGSTGSTGTYFQTSAYYLTRFGIDLKQYMVKHDLYEAIESLGEKVNRSNKSPVDGKTSSRIRHTKKEQFESIVVPVAEKIQKEMVSDFVALMRKDKNVMMTFMHDMLNKIGCKEVEDDNTSYMPDRYIVYNYTTDEVFELNLPELMKNIAIESNDIHQNDKGARIGNVRFQLSWKNGFGLYNPALYIFLK